MGKMIYLDNAATTKTAPEVVEAMLPYFTEFYGNASTVYDFAANSKAAIAKGRQQIADVIGAKKEEIYFTAGGSESDNWALRETTSSQPRSSIMRSFIPVSIWRRNVERRSHILMWMRMVLLIWMSSRRLSHRRQS